MKKEVMKICFLAPANNYHTIKWCNWFSSRGHEVSVISFVNGEIKGTKIYWINSGAETNASDVKKLKYLLQAGKVRKIIKLINPDIVNAHYATSYGTVAALAGLRGYILSVWGSDVYDFPNKSLLHKILLKYSLFRAKNIFSTSKSMAKEINKYTSKKVYVTPFGVDMDLFNPNKRRLDRDKNVEFIVGTVKALKEKYGIEDILRAVAIVREKYPEINIKLRIAGKGEDEYRYKKIAKQIEIDDITTWLGFISQEEAAMEWANMDVAIIASISESFGVSAVEAEACETATIITNIPGLMEATDPSITSIVVKRHCAEEIAEAIYYLYNHEELRYKMGKAGRRYVFERYEINKCFEDIELLYKKMRKNMLINLLEE